MTTATTGERQLLRFAEKILALLDQGQFTATYKYAVLLGIMDLCMEKVGRTGVPPSSITTLQLAEKTVELYWRHAVEFGSESGVLRQNPGSQMKTITAIRRFRRDTSYPSLARAKSASVDEYWQLVRDVEWHLVEMPLPRLQFSEDPFIYEISWTREDVMRRAFTAYQRGRKSTFDNVIKLKTGAAESLLALNSLLRPFIQAGWAAKVAKINALEESRLSEFLFEADRVALRPLRTGLVELQSGACFYCDRPMKGKVEIDHFVPWSRYPDNRLDNLVATHRECNNHKRDFLAADRHVERWRHRNGDPVLEQIANDKNWERDAGITLGVARSIYLGLPDGSPLWVEGSEFHDSARTALQLVLT